MAYKKKIKQEVEEQNLRTAHTNLDSSEINFDEMLHESLLIYDQSLYFLRWEYFSCRDCEFIRLPEYPSWFELCNLVSKKDAWINSKLDINVKKQTIKDTRDAWMNYWKAKSDYFSHPEKYETCPRMPNYLYRTDDYHTITVDKTRFRGDNPNAIRIPCTKIDITIPKFLKKEWITEMTIKYANGHIKVSFTYDYKMRMEYEREQKIQKGILKDHTQKSNKKKHKRILSIDLGKVNIITGMTFGCGKEDTSFVIRGHMFQQKINETCATIARLQSDALISKNKEITKISKRDGLLKIFKLSESMNDVWTSYNNYTDNQVGNISEMIIDFCVEHRIELIIIGYNEGWKQEIDLAKKTNRVFCHIPHKRIINTISYKAKERSIELKTVEESYTSKCDHLAFEEMCHHDTYLGKRVKRGMFKSSTGRIIHGDVNGCIGMIRKAKVIPDAVLIEGLRDRGDVVSPVVLNVRGFVPHKQRSPKNHAEAA